MTDKFITKKLFTKALKTIMTKDKYKREIIKCNLKCQAQSLARF
jgi:hypothetical protein